MSFAAPRFHGTLRRRILRWTGAAALVLQLFALGAVPVAEAALEQESRQASSHVESEGSERCPLVHNHLVCQLCRSITEVGAAAPHVSLLDTDHVTFEAPSAAVSILPQRSRCLPLGSRAPPRS